MFTLHFRRILFTTEGWICYLPNSNGTLHWNINTKLQMKLLLLLLSSCLFGSGDVINIKISSVWCAHVYIYVRCAQHMYRRACVHRFVSSLFRSGAFHARRIVWTAPGLISDASCTHNVYPPKIRAKQIFSWLVSWPA